MDTKSVVRVRSMYVVYAVLTISVLAGRSRYLRGERVS